MEKGELINTIIIIGNLTKDVELKSVGQDNKVMATTAVAVKRRFSRDDKSDFFNVKAFGKTGELLGTMKKGQKVGLQGRMEIDNVKDEYGNWKTYANMVVEQITFVTPKENGNMNTGAPSPYDFSDIDEQLPF